MQEEVWRDIIGFDEYKISDFGNVIRHTTGYIPFSNTIGYERINFGNMISISINKLIN